MRHVRTTSICNKFMIIYQWFNYIFILTLIICNIGDYIYIQVRLLQGMIVEEKTLYSFGDICGLTECYSKQSCLFSCDLYSTDNLILIILSHLFPLRSIGSSCCDIAAPEIHLRYNICLCARRFVFANLSYSLL